MPSQFGQGGATGAGAIGLSPEAFARAFPFHFACDAGLTLIQAGASLLRLYPDLRPGLALPEIFEFKRPSGNLSPERLARLEGSLVVLRHRAKGIMLRGQFLATEGLTGWVFLGSPWLMNTETLDSAGLTLDDFPPHDTVIESLLFSQTQQAAINDLRLLADRLEQRREQVAKTEAMYRAAISAADAVPYQEDSVNDAFSYTGEGFEALTGYAPGELTPSRLRTLAAPADRDADGTYSQRLRDSGGSLRRRSEYPFRTRGGELRWLRDASVTITDADGTPVGATGMLEDVTARHNAEERLRHSEAEAWRLAIVTSRTSSAVALTNADRGIEWVNEAFTALTGFSLEEVRGRLMRDVLGLGEVDAVMADRSNAAMLRCEPFRGEVRLRRKDGGTLWVAAEAQPLLDADGTLRGFTLVGTDITGTKTYERRLEELTAELSAILSVTPGGVVAVDGLGRVAYCNEAFAAIVGRSASDLQGVTAADLDGLLLARCAPGEHPAPMLDIADGGGDVLRLVNPARVFARSVRFIEGSDVVSRWRAFYLRDVTQQVEIDRMKSEFLSTAAHELRTPMSSVHGFAELLVSRDFDADTARTIVRTIHRQSSLLVQMVNELLDLARMEAGEGRDFVYETQELAPLVRETANGLMMPGDPRRVEFVPADGDSLQVSVDAAKLRLAVTNVLSNAYKYSRGRGAIRVSLPTRQRHGRVEVGVRVQDEGIGMTPDQLSHVFDRFYRADPSGAVPGTGLGMTLVKEIVETMHGSVEVKSEFGRGTTVTLWLPVAGGRGRPGSNFNQSWQAHGAGGREQ